MIGKNEKKVEEKGEKWKKEKKQDQKQYKIVKEKVSDERKKQNNIGNKEKLIRSKFKIGG